MIVDGPEGAGDLGESAIIDARSLKQAYGSIRRVAEYVIVAFCQQSLGKENPQVIVFTVNHSAPLILLRPGHKELTGSATAAPYHPTTDLKFTP